MRAAARAFDPALVASAGVGVVEPNDDLARRPQLRVRGRDRHRSSPSAPTVASSTTPNTHQLHGTLVSSSPSRPSHSGTRPSASARASPNTPASAVTLRAVQAAPREIQPRRLDRLDHRLPFPPLGGCRLDEHERSPFVARRDLRLSRHFCRHLMYLRDSPICAWHSSSESGVIGHMWRYGADMHVDDYNQLAIRALERAQKTRGVRSAEAFARLLAERTGGYPSSSTYHRWLRGESRSRCGSFSSPPRRPMPPSTLCWPKRPCRARRSIASTRSSSSSPACARRSPPAGAAHRWSARDHCVSRLPIAPALRTLALRRTVQNRHGPASRAPLAIPSGQLWAACIAYAESAYDEFVRRTTRSLDRDGR